jgi:hypothetical protein
MCKDSKGSVNEIIKICVGGQDFKTTRGTLMSDQNSMLAKMFESDVLGRVPAVKDPDSGAYFIDRSARYFESILNFLRTGQPLQSMHPALKFLLQELVQKVLEMMDEMKAKCVKGKQDEVVTFTKFQAFCQDTAAEKLKAISDAKESIAQLSADIQTYDSNAKVLAEEISKLDASIAMADLSSRNSKCFQSISHSDQ